MASPSPCCILGCRSGTSMIRNSQRGDGKAHVACLKKSCASRMHDGMVGT